MAPLSEFRTVDPNKFSRFNLLTGDATGTVILDQFITGVDIARNYMYPSPIGEPTYVLKVVDTTKPRSDTTRYTDVSDGSIALTRDDPNGKLIITPTAFTEQAWNLCIYSYIAGYEADTAFYGDDIVIQISAQYTSLFDLFFKELVTANWDFGTVLATTIWPKILENWWLLFTLWG